MDERDRQTLREQLEVVLGDQPAGVLMELLETPGSDDLARRSDVLAIGARLEGIEARLDRMDARLDQMERRFDLVDARFEKVQAVLTLKSAEASKTTVFTGIAVAMSSWGLLFAALGFS